MDSRQEWHAGSHLPARANDGGPYRPARQSPPITAWPEHQSTAQPAAAGITWTPGLSQ
ncbi:hypothetical protein GGH92_010241, partial [Coemansia sp. RSA 2673]